nr:hypothetical protein [Okeania sp. SIO3I5]
MAQHAGYSRWCYNWGKRFVECCIYSWLQA